MPLPSMVEYVEEGKGEGRGKKNLREGEYGEATKPGSPKRVKGQCPLQGQGAAPLVGLGATPQLLHR